MNSTSLPLQVQDLTRRYGQLVAVQRSELRGASGGDPRLPRSEWAGKTTTLRMCAGLLAPDCGRIEVAGAPIADQPLLARARLGFVPDRPFLYERLTAREFLDFVAALYDVPADLSRQRAETLIERLDLTDAART
jgi:ABC-2 type transport system ATP-binding protein